MALRKRLPPLPKMICTPLGPVTVERPAAILNEDGSTSDDLGEVCFMSRTIRIIAGLSLITAWQTLHHEKHHLTFWDAGVTTLSHDLEEQLCNVLATADVAVMVAQLSKD